MPRARRLHQQGARRGRLRVLVPRRRGRLPGRAAGRHARAASWAIDPAELRLHNLLPPEQFPYTCKTGWVYDSGDYPRALRKALESGYDALRAEQARAAGARGELMGIGISFFTEAVGAGPRKHMDIAGLGMNDGAALRISPTGKAQLAISVQTQGQGHETTFAQIVADELGIPPEDVDVIHGDTDTTPYGLGTYGSRSTPVSGRRRRAGGAQGPRPRPDRGRGDARGLTPRPGVGQGPAGPLVRQGRPRAGGDDPGDRDGRARIGRAAAGRRVRAGRRDRLRPAQPDLPVRRLHLRGRRRSRHRQGQRTALRRRRRLRHPDQPDDHRGPGPRRAHRRRRAWR